MSSTLTIGTVKRTLGILLAIAVVVVAGVIVGQAPAIFGTEVNPEASIEFDDQQGDGTTVTVDRVTLSDGGFVTVGDGTRDVVGVSEHLDDGTHENVTVELREDADRELLGELVATPHQDTDDDGDFDFVASDGEDDQPYLADGYPVSDEATVTMEERPPGEATGDSFVVESVDGPEEAGTNETLTFTAEIRNPTDQERRQHAELRADGAVLSRQLVSLGPDETGEVVFEVEGIDVGSGSHTYGVYTAEDGALGEIDVEYDGPASIEVTNATAETVAVETSIPADGFVGVENDEGDIVGTSEALSAGENQDATVDVSDVDAENETLTAVAFEGDPDDAESATAFADDGERVAATVEVDADE